MTGKTVVVRFMDSDGWREETITGTLKSLDDDLIQVEIAPDASVVSIASANARTPQSNAAPQILYIPWRAIRSLSPVEEKT